jgi:glycosyltransferase involved in cell wall biosynthesis
MDKIKILMLGESLDRSGGIVSVEKLILKYTPAEIAISHLATLPNGSTIRKIFVFFRALGSLTWQLSTTEIDLVYIHVAERGSAFRQAATATISWLFHKPVILHSHSADFHVFYANLPAIIRTGLSWAFRRSTRFIVLSHSWKKFYVENLGLKPAQVMVLPNPVKFPSKIPQRINSEKITFLFLGKIGERKGAFDLISAFAAIPSKQKQNVELIIAGDGEGQRAREIIENLNLSQHIKILDWVNEDQRDELLETANVFILPSYNEGLPMALLEAMSWGLPVITTPVGGIPELVTSGKNGLLVNPGEIEKLLESMQSLIENETLRLSLGNAARATVSPFEISKYCTELGDIFRQCCDHKIQE